MDRSNKRHTEPPPKTLTPTTHPLTRTPINRDGKPAIMLRALTSSSRGLGRHLSSSSSSGSSSSRSRLLPGMFSSSRATAPGGLTPLRLAAASFSSRIHKSPQQQKARRGGAAAQQQQRQRQRQQRQEQQTPPSAAAVEQAAVNPSPTPDQPTPSTSVPAPLTRIPPPGG